MPRVQMTPTVKIALYALRIYLLVLLTLIGIKACRVFSAAHSEAKQSETPAATKHSPEARPDPLEAKARP